MKSRLTEPVLASSVHQQQIELEKRAKQRGIDRHDDRLRDAIRRGVGANLPSVEWLLAHWYPVLQLAIADECKAIRSDEPAVGRRFYGPVLTILSPDVTAAVTLRTATSQLLRFPQGVKRVHLAYMIGKDVVAVINERVLKRYYPEARNELDRRRKNPDASTINWLTNREVGRRAFEKKQVMHLGAALLSLLIDTASAGDYMEDVFTPAFETHMVRSGRKSIAYVRLSHATWALIDKADSKRRALRPILEPMLVRPYPWGKGKPGGYATIHIGMTLRSNPETRRWRDSGDLTLVYESLNALQDQGRWRINRRVLDVMSQVYAHGGAVGHMPPSNDLPMPPRLPEDAQDEDKVRARRIRAEIHAENNQRRTSRIKFEAQLAQAERFVDADVFYQPHQIDFRGRFYAAPPELNHQQDDTARAIMEFADPVPLDHDGERAIMLHVANTAGVDDVSLNNRIEWVMANAGNIERVVSDPIGTMDWWRNPTQSAKDLKTPWQFLAACFALVDDEAKMHMPTQWDGSCNGYQHYAGTLRDPITAELVNLHASTEFDAPNSIYMIVLAETVESMRDDANVYAQQLIDLLLGPNGKQVVKTPVMTEVYGVTAIGSSRQVRDKLRKYGFAKDDALEAGRYLSRKIKEQIVQHCPGAAAGMAWIQDVAEAVARSGHVLRWTSPMGLPIVQSYRQIESIKIATVLGDLHTALPDEGMPPAKAKQVNGSAPNVIHGIDAAHGGAVARGMRDRDMPFALVHDSYWCHAQYAKDMNGIIRDEFCKLHEKPLLDDLARQWGVLYPRLRLPPPPCPGEFDIAQIHQSMYAFS